MLTLLVVIVVGIITRILGPIRADNAKIYVVLFVIMKLYRTFATVFISIYCFEVVNDLFYQIAYNVMDTIQNLYNRIYNVFQCQG